jgi:hypothetical protein
VTTQPSVKHAAIERSITVEFIKGL